MSETTQQPTAPGSETVAQFKILLNRSAMNVINEPGEEGPTWTFDYFGKPQRITTPLVGFVAPSVAHGIASINLSQIHSMEVVVLSAEELESVQSEQLEDFNQEPKQEAKVVKLGQ